MSLRKDILERFREEIEKQPNPWQPYRGDAGGRGWINVITGEVRYQDDRPQSMEGVDEGDGLPRVSDDVPGELDSLDPDDLELGEHLEEGMEVTADVKGIEHTGEVTDIEYVEQEDRYEVVLDDGTIVWAEEITDHPVELEPPDGWADGWMAAPDDHYQLESGQTVELYDLERGEYVMEEIKEVGDIGGEPYVRVLLDDGRDFEFLGGEPAGASSDVLVTGAEDIYPPIELPEESIPDDLKEYEDILYWDDAENEIREATVEEIKRNSQGEIVEARITPEGADGTLLVTQNQSTINDHRILDEEAENRLEIEQLDTVDEPELYPDDASDLALHDGALASIEHPTDGELVGEITIKDHGEKGVHAYVGESEVGIPLDDPEHPLARVAFGEIEDTWEPLHGPGAVAPGETLLINGEPRTVAAADKIAEEVVFDDGTEMELEQALAAAEHRQPAELPPEPMGASGWTGTLPHKFKEKDTLVFWDEETGELVDDTVEADHGSSVRTENYGAVEEEEIRLWADTGYQVPNQVEPGDVSVGSVVTVAQASSSGTLETELYVTDVKPHGTPVIEGLDEDGNNQRVRLDQQNNGLVDHDRHGDATDVIDQHSDWQEVGTDQVASSIYEDVTGQGAVSGSYLSKLSFWKSQQESIRSRFYQYFDPDEVDAFYDAIGSWKIASGADQNTRMIESAFREALDIESRVRGEHEDQPEGPDVPEEWIGMAEVANQMSRQFYEEHLVPNKGDHPSRTSPGTSLRSFWHQWLEDPEVEAFDLDGRALNNFDYDPQSTYSNARWSFETQVAPEDVGLATDYMFNPMEKNPQEDELWVIPDNLELRTEDINIDIDLDATPTPDIDSWDAHQTQTIASSLAQDFNDLLDDESEVSRPDSLSDPQVETLLEIADRAEETGATNDSAVASMVGEVMDLAEERGLRDQLDGRTLQDVFPYAETVEDIPRQTELTVQTGGEDRKAIVTDANPPSGEIEVEDDQGGVYWVEPDDIVDVAWIADPYGAPAEAAEQATSEDFEPLDDALVWSGGKWTEATILDVDGDGWVEYKTNDGRSGKYHGDEEARLAPTKLIDEPSEESEGSAPAWEDNPDQIWETLSTGDTVRYEDESFEQQESTVTEVFSQDEIYVTDEGMQPGDAITLDQIQEAKVEPSSGASGGSDTSANDGATESEPSVETGDTVEYEYIEGGTFPAEVVSIHDDGPVLQDLETNGMIYPDQYEEIVSELDDESEGPADSGSDGITDESDVEPGDEVYVPHWDSIVEIDEYYEDPVFGEGEPEGVQIGNDILDFDQLEPVSEAPDDL